MIAFLETRAIYAAQCSQVRNDHAAPRFLLSQLNQSELHRIYGGFACTSADFARRISDFAH